MEGVHVGAEELEPAVEFGEVGGGEGGSGLEAILDGGFEVVEVSGVEGGGFGGLDAGEDVAGFGPLGGGVEGLEGDGEGG
jgi:hypothetical protein